MTDKGVFYPTNEQEFQAVLEILNTGDDSITKGEVREQCIQKIKQMREVKEVELKGQLTVSYKYDEHTELFTTIDVPWYSSRVPNKMSLMGIARVAVEEVIDRAAELGLIET